MQRTQRSSCDRLAPFIGLGQQLSATDRRGRPRPSRQPSRSPPTFDQTRFNGDSRFRRQCAAHGYRHPHLPPDPAALHARRSRTVLPAVLAPLSHPLRPGCPDSLTRGRPRVHAGRPLQRLLDLRLWAVRMRMAADHPSHRLQWHQVRPRDRRERTRLVAMVHPENIASARVLTKLGFAIERSLRYSGVPDTDVNLFARAL